ESLDRVRPCLKLLGHVEEGCGQLRHLSRAVVVERPDRRAVAGVVYVSRTPNNIIKHLYGERGKVTLAAIAILGGTLLIGLI
ncbi:hypothetical protein, partial [Mesorhizobium sp. M7A.F.Ca.CA.002.03.1.1]|uniref:hypothetical protein n=1 Tax=Mesorhizobium sp. M7A.F.Ca.CA.002.03.1.1 TaxID=2496679 RepID=UPI0013DF5B44